MIKGFNELYTELQDQTGDDSAAQLTIFKRWINDTQNIVLGAHPWKFLETTRTITTAASTARYNVGANVRKIIHVETTPDGGTTIYRPDPIEDPDYWEYLQSLNASASNIPRAYYQEGNDLLLWPSYSTVSHTITVRFRKRVIPMSRADYTTGNITTVTQGGTTVTGASSPAWTGRKPVGEQWLQIAQSAGDFFWYRVSSITSDTVLELEAKYLGASIAAGSSSYILAEAPSFPGEYHNLCFYRPMALYYMKMEDGVMADRYWMMYDGGFEAGKTRKIGGMLGAMIDESSGMQDAAFYPREDRLATAEDIARTTISVLG